MNLRSDDPFFRFEENVDLESHLLASMQEDEVFILMGSILLNVSNDGIADSNQVRDSFPETFKKLSLPRKNLHWV